MNKKHSLRIVVFAAILFSITSCKSREEKVIDRLDSLSERIEKNGHKFDADDWADVLEDLADIHEDMEDCEFTKEELKAIGRADGRLTAIIMKKGAKALGRDAFSILKTYGSYFNGFRKGIEDNYNSEDLNDVEEEIKNALKDFEDDWME